MKKSNSIYTVCYVGIIIMFILIFLPPLAKKLYPEVQLSNSSILKCEFTEELSDGSKVKVTNSWIYKESKLQKLIFIYKIDENIIDEQILNESEQMQNKYVFEKVAGVDVKTGNNEYRLTFDYNENEYKDSNLKPYQHKFDEQKEKMESKGYQCVKEN